MDEVGCPDPAPVLERMLSILSCWARLCHCSVPAASWLICWVTTYLLGRIAVGSDTTPTTPPMRTGNRSVVPSSRADGPVAALLESLGREEKDPDRLFYESGSTGRKGDYGSGGSQDDAGTVRGRGRRGGAREFASGAPGGGLREEEGGHDLRLRGPGREDGQTDRPIPERPLYHR